MLLRRIAWAWALAGVLAIILFPIMRVAPIALEGLDSGLSSIEIALALVWIVFMGYSEGHRGFYRSFAPRVVSRAEHFLDKASLRWYHIALAPAYCIGYVFAPRRRMIVSWCVTFAIAAIVIIVSQISQPWRGIIDAGVVVGLSYGLAAVLYLVVRSLLQRGALTPTDA